MIYELSRIYKTTQRYRKNQRPLQEWEWLLLVQICAQNADESCQDCKIKPDTKEYYTAYAEYMSMSLYESSLNLPNFK